MPITRYNLLAEFLVLSGRKCKTYECSVVGERDNNDYYVAFVPALPQGHNQARSLDDLLSRIRGAIAMKVEVENDEIANLEFVGVQGATVSA
jgi:predicted RNase H-like HicB family nuclease